MKKISIYKWVICFSKEYENVTDNERSVTSRPDENCA